MRHFGLIAIICVLALTGCSHRQQEPWRQTGGMAWNVTPYTIIYSSARPLDDSIPQILSEIEQSASVFCPTSLVSRVNRGDTAVRADSLLRQLIALSQQVNQQSRGAFDPTIGQLIDVWGFGTTAEADAPSPKVISDALTRCGIRRVAVDAYGRIIKPHPDMQFNFSAIAKGAAVDAVADMLRRNGCRDFMVEIGGEVYVAGHNARGEKWHIQIDDPQAPEQHKPLQILQLTDCAVATSGNYRNHNSRGQGHTISPRTGYPVASAPLSATVIASTCALADAWATAAMASDSVAALTQTLDSLGLRHIIVGGL